MHDVHVGVQAILDASWRTHGYVLSFRPGEASSDQPADQPAEGQPDPTEAGDHEASAVVVNTFMHFGLKELVGDNLAFLRITRSFAVGRLPLPFEPAGVVLELPGDLVLDDEALAGVRRLVAEGFGLALADFDWGNGREQLLDVATYVKVDVSARNTGWLRETVQRLHERRVRVVATEVGTVQVMEACMEAGFDFFQGDFLLRPQVLSGASISPGVGARFALLSKLADADVSIRDVESLVAADAALNYRLLRAANSAAAGLPRRVDSVRTAIVMLGLERLRSWLMLMTVAEHSDSHEAQLAAAATRARMCELLAARWAQVPAQGAFLMGLLSRLDLLLGVGMDTVVEGLPLEDTMQDALLHRAGSMGQLLGAVESYETYTQNPFSGALSLETFTDAYLASIAWSNALLDATRQAS